MTLFLTGYHGTTLDRANSILESGRFIESNGEREWLGKGIYFYFDISDAIAWKEASAILHSVIRVDDAEYLDINTEEGTDIFNEAAECISFLQSKQVRSSANAQKNQCAIMNILWDSYPKLKVMSAALPPYSKKVETVIDLRPQRREFCVRSNEFIKFTHLIKRSDLYD